MADKQNPHEPRDVELTEIVRGNHAWNTCDGGVRGLTYSPERIKELAGKKDKNYWKIGALVGAGIAALASSIIYISPQTQPTITQQEVLSREETLERFAPRIEYYGIPNSFQSFVSTYCGEFDYMDDMDCCQNENCEKRFTDQIFEEATHVLNAFGLSGGIWNSELHYFVLDCGEDENNSENNCNKKELMSFKLDDIIYVKGVIINDELAYVEISAIEYKLTGVSGLLDAGDIMMTEDHVNELYARIMYLISSHKINHENKHGSIKIKIVGDDEHYQGNDLVSLLDSWACELVIEIDDFNVGKKNGVDKYGNNLEGDWGGKFNHLYYSIKQEIVSYLSENYSGSFMNSPFESGKTEFVLLKWDYSVVKRKIKPDLTKNTPEESILLVYDFVDSIRALIKQYDSVR
ncbi:hypothetical protein J4434_01085 [Candidatus Woesearchaeota archaeon]|nr:hypothetical protein [Candidatus Woesearchaeota archaeon]